MYVYNVHYVLTEIYGCTDYQVFSDDRDKNWVL